MIKFKLMVLDTYTGRPEIVIKPKQFISRARHENQNITGRAWWEPFFSGWARLGLGRVNKYPLCRSLNWCTTNYLCLTLILSCTVLTFALYVDILIVKAATHIGTFVWPWTRLIKCNVCYCAITLRRSKIDAQQNAL